MKRFLKLRHGEKGFTLIELLVVVAILGVLAAIVIPNVANMMGAATLNGANTEAASIKTAATAYMADNNGTWPANSAALVAGNYLAGGELRATYALSSLAGEEGLIDMATPAGPNGWQGITWNKPTQLWIKS